MHTLSNELDSGRRVSVIIPCYNAQEHIDATIQSVLAQTYQNFEIILVDDHSKDNTLKKLKEWEKKDTRIRVLQTETNTGGPAAGRNIGMKQADGDWIAFLDADDLWHPHKLETQISLMNKHKTVFSFSEKFNFKNEQDYWNLIRSFNFDDNAAATIALKHNSLLCKNVIPTSSVVMKTSLAREVIFDTDKKTIAVEDYKKWLYTHQKIDFSIGIRAPLLGYRVHPHNLSKQKWKMLKKVETLLSEYEISGRKLGLKKYYYLFTYVFFSVYDLLRRRFVL